MESVWNLVKMKKNGEQVKVKKLKLKYWILQFATIHLKS